MDPKIKLAPNKLAASREYTKLFQSIIGCLLYITLGTRPDIGYSVIKLARFTANSALEYITTAKRVLRYLKATIDYTIVYRASEPGYISGYCDADYAGDIIKAKSTTGYIFILAGGPISWKSKLQSFVA